MPDRTMQTIRVVTVAVAVAMAITIIYGFAAGDFGDEGSDILGLAWGRVTLIDLYLGFVLFGGWIALRERSMRAVPWILALAVLGNLAAAIYAYVAARQSESVDSFLIGDRSPG